MIIKKKKENKSPNISNQQVQYLFHMKLLASFPFTHIRDSIPRKLFENIQNNKTEWINSVKLFLIN